MIRDIGVVKICRVINTAEQGSKPQETLEEIAQAYAADERLGVTRHYAALSAGQKIDRLIKVYACEIPENAEYVVTEDETQYRISLKQQDGDDWTLTLERLGSAYDLA